MLLMIAASQPQGCATAAASERPWRWISLLAEFAVLPAVVTAFAPAVTWLPLLWLLAACAWWRSGDDGDRAPLAMSPRAARLDLRRELRRIVARFAVCGLSLTAGVAWALPQRWLDWPSERPVMWLSCLVLYPVLSVYPQELVYRRLFFLRYGDLFASGRAVSLASAVAFALMHAVFRNGWVMGLSFVGGFFFAETYRRAGSLRLVCFEHALYGSLIFTIGLGNFFSHAAAV